MTDTGNNSGRTIGNIMGIKGKPKPTFPVVMDESQQLDESIKYAIAATNQLRDELSATKAKLVETTNAFAEYKADVTNEMMTQKQEYDSKSSMLRAKIDAVDNQLKDTGRKLEHFERLSFELGAKCEDIEKFYLHELCNIRDAANHMVLSQISGINNATIALNDTTKHSGEGLVKQVENSANNMIAFIDDLKKKRSSGEYRPRPNPMEDKLQPLAPDAEEALAKLVQQIKARPQDDENLDEHA